MNWFDNKANFKTMHNETIEVENIENWLEPGDHEIRASLRKQ
jgi:hypothetical protein